MSYTFVLYISRYRVEAAGRFDFLSSSLISAFILVIVPTPPYIIAVYTWQTLAPAFNICKHCWPFVMPPVAKMTFCSLDSLGDGTAGFGVADVGVDDAVEGSADAVMGAEEPTGE